MSDQGRSIREIEGLGPRLNGVLFARGITQTELAEKSGVSRDRVWTAINRSSATIKTVEKLAKALGVTSTYLVTGDNPEGQWEPTNAVREESPSYAGAQLEDFLANMDKIVRTLRNFPGGDVGMKLKIGFLNTVEDVARDTGNKLPIEYYQLRKRVSDGEL